MAYEIKGICEMCGFAYKGTVKSMESVICPNCGKESQNFDEASIVDELNKAEETTPEYKEVTF